MTLLKLKTDFTLKTVFFKLILGSPAGKVTDAPRSIVADVPWYKVADVPKSRVAHVPG